jgi:glutamine cyclotransferase
MNNFLPFTKRACLAAFALSVLLLAVLGPVAAQDDDPFTTPVTVLVPEVISEHVHDTSAYTQGLLLYEGEFYESAGQYGESTLRRVNPDSGEVLQMVDVPEEYFAEGLERVGDRLIQLTWKEEAALVYDLETFEQIDTIAYQGEGWGLCTDGEYLYMSDGSPFLSVRDLDTFDLIFDGMVTVQGQPVTQINELECVGDYVYANVWKTDVIIKINKKNGVVVAVVDVSGLLTEDERAELDGSQVLNGIAYDAENDTFWITGKEWPKMFQVRFVEAQQ